MKLEKFPIGVRNQSFHVWVRFYAEREFEKRLKWGSKEKWLSEAKREIERLTDFKFRDTRELENEFRRIWTEYLSNLPTDTPRCAVCGKPVRIGEDIHWHHVSYAPPKIIPVHPTCHMRIHWGSEAPELRPRGRSKLRSPR